MESVDSCTESVQAIALLGKQLRTHRKTAPCRQGFFDIRGAGNEIRRADDDIRHGAHRIRHAGNDIRRCDKRIRLHGSRIRRRFDDGRRPARGDCHGFHDQRAHAGRKRRWPALSEPRPIR
jgi:hypothetical protein